MGMGVVPAPSNKDILRKADLWERKKIYWRLFLAGALYRGYRGFMRILITFLGKIHRDPL